MPYSGLESRPLYLMAVMKKSFQTTPVAQSPLPRVVPVVPQTVVAGIFTVPPENVVSCNSLCVDYNRQI